MDGKDIRPSFDYLPPDRFAEPPCWRLEFERCGTMINNDTWTEYTDHDLNGVEDWGSPSPGLGCSSEGRMMMCRPVLRTEVRLGLDTAWKGSVIPDVGMPDEVPLVTRYLDAWWKIMVHLDLWMHLHEDRGGGTIEEHLAFWIGLSFYDCLSCGMPPAETDLCWVILKTCDCDLNIQVYPKAAAGDEWHTLRDWMAEVGNRSERLAEVLPEFEAAAMCRLE